MIKIIKDFVKRKEESLIRNSNDVLSALFNEWVPQYSENRIYLTKRKISELNGIIQRCKRTKIPWYLFWDKKLKNNIKGNIAKILELPKYLQTYNYDFIEKTKKEYADLFRKSGKELDDRQKEAVIKDDKYNLIIAGAGSGKTEALITRIAYLIEREHDKIMPGKILAIAFQDKAVQEIKERLKKEYSIDDVKIKTFHSLGNEILKEATKHDEVQPKLKFGGLNYEKEYSAFIRKIYDEFLEHSDIKENIIQFLENYDEDNRSEEDFETKEEFYNYQKDKRYFALDGTETRSEVERAIMNLFIRHNLNGKRIDVRYEEPAEWMKYWKGNNEFTPKPDFYLPEYDVYVECWAFDKNGQVPEWFEGINPTAKYISDMKEKKSKYQKYNKTLIETSFAEYKGHEFIDNLKKKILEALKTKYPSKKFEFEKVDYKELVNRVWRDCVEITKILPFKIAQYITLAKTYNLSPRDIEKRLYTENWSKKQISFSNIALRIYSEYQKRLFPNYIDFADMINLAKKKLERDEGLYHNKFDHILIDEFQDISHQRYELIAALMNNNPDCKLFCVGDDWQSIMGFSGSNLDLFINFHHYFPDPEKTYLETNYRSIRSIVETGATIIKNNKNSQIHKNAYSNQDINAPIQLYSSEHKENFEIPYFKQITKHCVSKMKELNKYGYKWKDMMILLRARNNSSGRRLVDYLVEYATEQNIPLDTSKKQENAVRLMTVHKSKGLQAKVVFILNMVKGTSGFPCELEDPDIFEPAIRGRKNDKEEEERRLFYVAITRAKELVLIYTQKCNKSKFLKEINKHIREEKLAISLSTFL